jgi:hypothetical protein
MIDSMHDHSFGTRTTSYSVSGVGGVPKRVLQPLLHVARETLTELPPMLYSTKSALHVRREHNRLLFAQKFENAVCDQITHHCPEA